jgi:hypothetical protein
MSDRLMKRREFIKRLRRFGALGKICFGHQLGRDLIQAKEEIDAPAHAPGRPTSRQAMIEVFDHETAHSGRRDVPMLLR